MVTQRLCENITWNSRFRQNRIASPRQIPVGLHSRFTLWGSVQERFWYFNEHDTFGNTNLWSGSDIDDKVQRYRSGLEEPPKFCKAIDAIGVVGKRGCLHDGSVMLAACLLHKGATHLTVIEDLTSVSVSHPQVSVLDQSTEKNFDFCVSVNVLNHIGLGRYGDALDPFGDFTSLERLRCLLRPHGVIYLALPFADIDCVVWNAHRIYDPLRLRLLAGKNWIPLLALGNGSIWCDDWRNEVTFVWRRNSNFETEQNLIY